MKDLPTCARKVRCDFGLMKLYQLGHSTPIAPATFQHYMRENASFEVMFTEGVEITIHVIVTTAPPLYILSSPGKGAPRWTSLRNISFMRIRA